MYRGTSASDRSSQPRERIFDPLLHFSAKNCFQGKVFIGKSPLETLPLFVGKMLVNGVLEYIRIRIFAMICNELKVHFQKTVKR